MSNLDELRAAAQAALTARLEVEREISRWQLERMDEFRAKLAEDMRVAFGSRRSDALAVERAANDAFLSAKEAAALAGNGHPHPLGIKLIEWRFTRPVGANKALAFPTGAVGVGEIITANSRHGRGRSVGRGTFVIRLLLKNGQPGARYVWKEWDIKNRWFPEGTKPEGATC